MSIGWERLGFMYDILCLQAFCARLNYCLSGIYFAKYIQYFGKEEVCSSLINWHFEVLGIFIKLLIWNILSRQSLTLIAEACWYIYILRLSGVLWLMAHLVNVVVHNMYHIFDWARYNLFRRQLLINELHFHVMF